jgi:hypothetical protein
MCGTVYDSMPKSLLWLQVDVVDMLRQLAAERVAKKRKADKEGNEYASSHCAPRATSDNSNKDAASEGTAPSSVSDANSLPQSEGSRTSATTKDKHLGAIFNLAM